MHTKSKTLKLIEKDLHITPEEEANIPLNTIEEILKEIKTQTQKHLYCHKHKNRCIYKQRH